jgi:hypothetical protein
MASYVHEFTESAGDVVDRVGARSLGLVSIAIGLTELCCPRQLEQTMGIGDGEHTGILRVLGVREIGTGIDILSHRDPTPGVWFRVFGDLLDGILLGAAAKRTRRPGGLMAVAAAVLPVVLLDIIFARRLSRRRVYAD